MNTDETTLKVEHMTVKECKELLQRVCYGHIGLVFGTHPYVVPMHYVYDKQHIYLFTLEGKKSVILEDNAEVCLQVEEISDGGKSWQSVIVMGDAVQLTDEEEIKRAVGLLVAVDSELTPAYNIDWLKGWMDFNVEIVYRITPTRITGRAAVS